MKGKILVLIIISVFIEVGITKGQARMYYSKKEILDMFQDKPHKIGDKKILRSTEGSAKKDTLTTLTVNFVRARIVYFFNSDDVCIMVFIYPMSRKYFRFYKKRYDNFFTRLNNKEWLAYDHDHHTSYIQVVHDKPVPNLVWSENGI